MATNSPGTSAEIIFEQAPISNVMTEEIKLLALYSQASMDLGYGPVTAVIHAMPVQQIFHLPLLMSIWR